MSATITRQMLFTIKMNAKCQDQQELQGKHKAIKLKLAQCIMRRGKKDVFI